MFDSVKKFKESENGPRPIGATGAEEELVALLLRYEIVCLLRLNKPHDAKEILVETTIDIQHRATSTASTVGKIDLLLLSLEVLTFFIMKGLWGQNYSNRFLGTSPVSDLGLKGRFACTRVYYGG